MSRADKLIDRLFSRIRISFPPAFVCVLLFFSVISAWGYASGLQPGDTLGNALMNAFGGCIWAEEVDVHEIISWMMSFIPSGIAASIILFYRLSRLLPVEGYRYGHVLRWYCSLMMQIALTVCSVALVQIFCVLLFARCSGHTGFSIWVNDMDGFTVQSTLQPCLAPILFLLYDQVIVLLSSVVYLYSRRMNWFYAAFLLPSLIGTASFSKPGRSSLLNPIHFGMACRLSVEGGYGVMPTVACGGLLIAVFIIYVCGGIYCFFSSPFDRTNEG